MKSCYFILGFYLIIAGCEVRDPVLQNDCVQDHFKVGESYSIKGKMYVPEKDVSYSEVGYASWYGDKFHNKVTANGGIFNKVDFTAAHRTLPLPSIVKVVNMENNKSIEVRINDRGPYAYDRIIDLSESAAEYLGFKDKGTALVQVSYLKMETEDLLADNDRYKNRHNKYSDYMNERDHVLYRDYKVVLSAEKVRAKAKDRVKKLKEINLRGFIVNKNGLFYIEIPCKRESIAYIISDVLKKKGYSNNVVIKCSN